MNMLRLTESELPMLDPDFDLADVFNDLPLPASDEEEAEYQRWVDIDLKRKGWL